MTDCSFEISPRDEPNRLKITFVDRTFGARALLGVNRVGSRRDADNRPLHFVFEPEVEADVRLAVARAAALDPATAARMAEAAEAAARGGRSRATAIQEAASVEAAANPLVQRPTRATTTTSRRRTISAS